MTGQSDDRSNFELWFGSKLESLMKDGDDDERRSAGFILAMVSFPLLERYLTRKSRAKPNSTQFRTALRDVLPELGTDDEAERFWFGFRHGLLHNVALNSPTHWLSHDKPAVEVHPDNVIWMNPEKFARRVLEHIRNDFDTYADPKPKPPQVFTQVEGQHAYTGTGNLPQ